MTLKIPNFAHGDYATVGAYIVQTLNVVAGLNYYVSLPLSFVTGGLTALLSYILVFYPLSKRGADITSLMIASFALSTAISSVLCIYADYMTLLTGGFFRTFSFNDFKVDFFGWKTFLLLPFTTGLVATLLLLLYLLLNYTRLGIAMRATVENPDLAETLGIDVNKTRAVAWFLAGGLAGLAGGLLPFRLLTSPALGSFILIRIFAASVLGGLNSLAGAVLGGYIVGFSEILGIYLLSQPPIYLSTAYRPAIPFIMLIVTLLVAPQGISGVLKLKGGSRR